MKFTQFIKKTKFFFSNQVSFSVRLLETSTLISIYKRKISVLVDSAPSVAAGGVKGLNTQEASAMCVCHGICFGFCSFQIRASTQSSHHLEIDSGSHIAL